LLTYCSLSFDVQKEDFPEMRVLPSLVLSPSAAAPFRKSIVLLLLVALAACGPKPVAKEQSKQDAPQAAQATPQDLPQTGTQEAANVPKEQPAPKAAAPKAVEAVAGGKATGIAGGWVNAGGACDSGASVQFNPDGTYMSEGENGTWSLEGKTLTVTTNPIAGEEAPVQVGPEQSTGDAGEKAVLTILQVSDTSAKVILSNGTNANWTRCSG
jgi:hypothetical protein